MDRQHTTSFAMPRLDILFSSNHNIHKSFHGLCFLASDPLIHSKIYQSKGLKPKNKGRTNFYECCDLTEKVCLTHTQNQIIYEKIVILYVFLIVILIRYELKYVSSINIL